MNEIYDNDNRFSSMQTFFNKYRTLLISTVIALVVAFGISFSLKAVSKINDEKAAIVFNEWADFLSRDDIANAEKSFDNLMSSFSKTGYAKIALLDTATKEASEGKTTEALDKFTLLIELTDGYGGNKIYNKLARVNSARLLASENELDKALLLLEKYSSSTSNAFIHELTGDILVKKDQSLLAKDQYIRAEELYSDETSKSIVAIKIANLK
ncbi:tetratricopeptide repeat protein [Gammaproteobacteria bacterium]|nr:tetratricopeptide repeat protein [Gammaproteobacteria bacterium]MDA8861367.1 tetratricopeptide repeat protein [Gammaproteobacteria bacterium]MDA9001080.1 tetratricopeptide repeat protein [Gammaproteobacteria bacterium]MDA9123772.1 tetratricopeptide repeat protein [Gammaproteobacteria bacterium]MDA9147096.1 tetratricopeptide repeat protein [Gammaproteobacteria bacterium]